MHEVDAANPVVRLCADGMQAEGEGRPSDARRLFEEAWAQRRDDFDASVAAHYLARHQDTPQATFEWNAIALRCAETVPDRARAFFPSLHLNLGSSYEQVGQPDQARRHYDFAASALADLPASPYARFVEGGIKAGLARTALETSEPHGA